MRFLYTNTQLTSREAKTGKAKEFTEAKTGKTKELKQKLKREDQRIEKEAKTGKTKEFTEKLKREREI